HAQRHGAPAPAQADQHDEPGRVQRPQGEEVSKSNIEILLGEWGAWKRGDNRSALGYPDHANFNQMRVDGQRYAEPDVLMVDDDLRRLDRFIDHLFPEVRAALIAHY